MTAKAANKRFLFEMRPEELGPNKRVKFVMSLPTCRKTGNDFTDSEKNLMRAAFIRMIDLGWKRPELILQTEDWMQKRATALEKKSDDMYFGEVRSLRCLDEVWACAYLAKRLDLSMGFLERVCGADPETWRHMFQYLLVCSDSLKMVEDHRDKEVTREALDNRRAEAGHRKFEFAETKELVEAKTLCFNWQRYGVYEIVWKENRATHIRHRPSGDAVALAEHVIITKRFTLEQNWMDFGAYLLHKPTSYDVASDLFAESKTGPWKCPALTNAAWQEITERAKRSVVAARSITETAKVVAPKAFNETKKTEAKKAALVKARETLKTTKANMSRKRSITFAE